MDKQTSFICFSIVTAFLLFQGSVLAQGSGKIVGKYASKISACGTPPCDAELEIKPKSGDSFQFSITSGRPGPKPSICNVEGDFTLVGDQAQWKSKTSECQLTFAFKGKLVKISAADDSACQSECGAGAGFLGDYESVH